MGIKEKVVSRIALIFRVTGISHEARPFAALNPDLIPFAAGSGDAESRLDAAKEALRMVALDGEFVDGVDFKSLRVIEFSEDANPPIGGVQYHFYVVDVKGTEPDGVRLLPYLDSDGADPLRDLRLRFRMAIELDEQRFPLAITTHAA